MMMILKQSKKWSPKDPSIVQVPRLLKALLHSPMCGHLVGKC